MYFLICRVLIKACLSLDQIIERHQEMVRVAMEIHSQQFQQADEKS
jgi:hypothetical protein